ncbi:hypothetical protein V6N13_011169 [Hibiscus sabdariffa]|uniref:Uncharacterized protein n=1 Tax=Hibiscus sabdariffa TaxID=183260 RepID=A0ABR2SBL7_9ROSI
MINKNLDADAWDKFIQAWIVLKTQDRTQLLSSSTVYHWHLQAEIAIRQAGKPGMTGEEVHGMHIIVVKDFVSRYLPAYKAYLPTLYSEGPNGSDPSHISW